MWMKEGWAWGMSGDVVCQRRSGGEVGGGRGMHAFCIPVNFALVTQSERTEKERTKNDSQ